MGQPTYSSLQNKLGLDSAWDMARQLQESGTLKDAHRKAIAKGAINKDRPFEELEKLFGPEGQSMGFSLDMTLAQEDVFDKLKKDSIQAASFNPPYQLDPLGFAIRWRKHEVVEQLLSLNAPIVSTRSDVLSRPLTLILHLQAKSRPETNEKLLQTLFEAGAARHQSWLPLDVAVAWRTPFLDMGGWLKLLHKLNVPLGQRSELLGRNVLEHFVALHDNPALGNGKRHIEKTEQEIKAGLEAVVEVGLGEAFLKTDFQDTSFMERTQSTWLRDLVQGHIARQRQEHVLDNHTPRVGRSRRQRLS